MKILTAILAAIGSLFKWAPALLGFLGPVGSIIGAVIGFVGQLIAWFFEGVTIVIKNPVTLVTVAIISTVTWGLGLDAGLRWDAHKVNVARADRDQWKAAHAKLMADARKADADNKTKLKSALDVKISAEKVEAAKPDAATPGAPAVAVVPAAPAAEPKRVQSAKKRAPATGSDSGDRSGLRGIFGL